VTTLLDAEGHLIVHRGGGRCGSTNSYIVAATVECPQSATIRSREAPVRKVRAACPRLRQNAAVASVQTADQIASILERLHRKRIALFQVLGINSLKSLTPPLDALVGEAIEGSEVADRMLTLHTSGHLVTVDLQRTGKVVWLASSEPFRPAVGPMPTVRLITEDGTVDLTEPAKTKRITVVVEERGK
jgi:hypothetical protein